MRIHVVVPITETELSQAEDYERVARPDVTVGHSFVDQGPESIESYYDEALALPGTLAQVAAAERAGADAVVIDCMGDPGMEAAREMSTALILGPAQSSMYAAAMLGHSFSVITVLDAVVPMIHDLAVRYGMADKLASIRSVDIPVLDLDDESRLMTALTEQSVAAIESDGAHVIIFGCTGMRDCADALRARLAELGHGGIPVVEPSTVAFKLAEALADLGLTHSTRTYAPPRAKKVTGYPALTGEVPA
jgi:allantoin racemase